MYASKLVKFLSFSHEKQLVSNFSTINVAPDHDVWPVLQYMAYNYNYLHARESELDLSGSEHHQQAPASP
jgi:hypothetical protein